MKEPLSISVPLLNTNEPEALLARLMVQEGDFVEAGAALALFETTKTSAEVTADRAGYVVGLSAEQGQSLHAGEILLWIAEDPEWQAPEISQDDDHPPAASQQGLRLTQPARELAEQANVNLADLPVGPLITLEWLEDWLENQQDLPPIDPKAIVVYGGGGHGKAVVELIQAVGGYQIIGFIDDGLSPGRKIMGVEVLGGGDHLRQLRREGVGQAANAVGGIGDINSRVRVAQRLSAAGFNQPSLIHPTAFVEPSANLQEGVQVFPQAYVGSQAKLASGVIVNTAAVVSHDCELSEFVNIAPGALLAGAVNIGARSLIGMGVTINLDVEVGAGCRVGNSAVVKQSVASGAIVPAGSIWPRPGVDEVQS